MESQRLDFHSTFRTLSYFNSSTGITDGFIDQILSTSVETNLDKVSATKEWQQWLQNYLKRIESEKEEWGVDIDAEREVAALSANPRFVLRQWVLEDVIAKVEKNSATGKRVLAKVLHVSVTAASLVPIEHSFINDSDGLQPF
jgi:serine/tyrosine/threonine adenylyltransferase